MHMMAFHFGGKADYDMFIDLLGHGLKIVCILTDYMSVSR